MKTQELIKQLQKQGKTVKNIYGDEGLIVWDSVVNPFTKRIDEKCFYGFDYFYVEALQNILDGKTPCFKELDQQQNFNKTYLNKP